VHKLFFSIRQLEYVFVLTKRDIASYFLSYSPLQEQENWNFSCIVNIGVRHNLAAVIPLDMTQRISIETDQYR